MVLHDQRSIVEALSHWLAAEGFLVVGGEHLPGRLLSAVARLQPDVVVVSDELPGLWQDDLIRRLTRVAGVPRVILWTRHDAPAQLARAKAAGASRVMTKQASLASLAQAILDVHERERGERPTAAPQPPIPPPSPLSEREQEVLILLARGFAGPEIARQLGVAPSSIDTYRRRASEKLGLRGRAALVAFVIEQGWLQQGSQES